MIIDLLKTLTYFTIEIIHLSILIIPILFYFGILKNDKLFKFIFLVILIIPLHWVFFNNQCALTLLSKSFKKNNNIKSELFLDKYFKKIFEYLSKKLKISKYELYRKFIISFIIVDIILMWDLTFRIKKCNIK